MNTPPVDTERAQLIQQRDKLIQDIELLREALRGEVDVDVDEGDPDVVEREKNVVLLAAMEARMASIEDALRSIEKGTYGICERCGNPIPPERLEVKPEATLCLSCQVEVEKLLKRGMVIQRPRWGLDLDEEVEED